MCLAMEDDGFQLVSRRKGAKARRSDVKPTACSDIEAWTDDDVSSCSSRLQSARDAIRSSTFLESFCEQLDQVIACWKKGGSLCSDSAAVSSGIDIVCYGIGPFGHSLQARCQMAVLLLIVEYLQAQNLFGKCLLYDPILQQGEARVVQDQGIHLIETNEEGRRTITRPTVFFMPHCGRSLYENVLASNWEPSQLVQLCLVGNGFSSYLERMPTRTFQAETPHLAHAQTIATEVKVEAKEHGDSFNDTAIHTFEMNCFPSTDVNFWQCGKGEFQDDDHVSASLRPSWRWIK